MLGVVKSQGDYPLDVRVEIQISELALRYIQAHTLSFPDVEVAGLLIGTQPEKQGNGRYLVNIHSALAGKYLKSTRTSVQITANTWSYFHQKIAELYPNGQGIIVGWYHDHPRLPVFWSQDDMVVQQTCFTANYHVALVLDPFKPLGSSKFYCWDTKQKSMVDTEFVFSDCLNTAW